MSRREPWWEQVQILGLYLELKEKVGLTSSWWRTTKILWICQELLLQSIVARFSRSCDHDQPQTAYEIGWWGHVFSKRYSKISCRVSLELVRSFVIISSWIFTWYRAVGASKTNPMIQTHYDACVSLSGWYMVSGVVLSFDVDPSCVYIKQFVSTRNN